MADDVLLNKTSIIERCLRRVQEEYDDTPAHLYENITKQDATILNLQRACQATIDQVGQPTSHASGPRA